MGERARYQHITKGLTAALTVVAWASLGTAPQACSTGPSTRSRAALWLLSLVVLGYGLVQWRKRS